VNLGLVQMGGNSAGWLESAAGGSAPACPWPAPGLAGCASSTPATRSLSSAVGSLRTRRGVWAIGYPKSLRIIDLWEAKIPAKDHTDKASNSTFARSGRHRQPSGCFVDRSAGGTGKAARRLSAGANAVARKFQCNLNVLFQFVRWIQVVSFPRARGGGVSQSVV
jgi:hypothetical protein